MYTLFSTKSLTRTFYDIEGRSQECLPDYPSKGGFYERRFAEVIGSGGDLRTLAEEIEKYLTGIESISGKLEAVNKEIRTMLGILSKILTAQENLRQQQQQSLDRRTQEIENVSNLLGIFQRVIQKVMFPWNR